MSKWNKVRGFYRGLVFDFLMWRNERRDAKAYRQEFRYRRGQVVYTFDGKGNKTVKVITLLDEIKSWIASYKVGK